MQGPGGSESEYKAVYTKTGKNPEKGFYTFYFVYGKIMTFEVNGLNEIKEKKIEKLYLIVKFYLYLRF